MINLQYDSEGCYFDRQVVDGGWLCATQTSSQTSHGTDHSYKWNGKDWVVVSSSDKTDAAEKENADKLVNAYDQAMKGI